MYTMSIIGLILFPVALISMFLLSVGGWDMAVLQFALLLCVYAFVYSFVGFVHTVRCKKRKKDYIHDWFRFIELTNKYLKEKLN